MHVDVLSIFVNVSVFYLHINIYCRCIDNVVHCIVKNWNFCHKTITALEYELWPCRSVMCFILIWYSFANGSFMQLFMYIWKLSYSSNIYCICNIKYEFGVIWLFDIVIYSSLFKRWSRSHHLFVCYNRHSDISVN